MPVYDARCQDCGVVMTYRRCISERGNTPECPQCGGIMLMVIIQAPASYVTGKFDSFKSVVDGSIISSQRSMEEHNKRNNVVCLSDGYDDATIKSGNFGKKPEVLDKKELASDIQEAIHMVEQGYKPEIGADDGQ